ncbi:uncharacterized protein TNCV_2694461 [Trichonephila clavipes]|nr:uncharacterized protein TNCV_2694461 [Trichonephila clavipes]
MEKGQEEIKNELKERMEKGQQEMQKGQEDLRNTLEKKIESVEQKITLKVEEKIARMEDLEKKLLPGGNENKNKIVPVSAFPELVHASPVLVTASTVSVKLSTYDRKTNWEVYKTQFSIISEANGWTEGVKVYQLATSLRGEAAEILQTLPDTERLNLNFLCNGLDLRFGQKYSKDYARWQMKTRLQKTRESL